MVIGHGMVGARFVEEVRRRDPDGERVTLTVLGAESRPAYNRVLLSTVLAGGLRPAMVALPVVDGVALHTGVAATALDRTARVVHADDGTVHPYDELVLATGCRAWLPPVDGLAAELDVVAVRPIVARSGVARSHAGRARVAPSCVARRLVEQSTA